MKSVDKNSFESKMYEIVSLCRLLSDYDKKGLFAYIETAQAICEEKIDDEPEKIVEYYFMKVQQMKEKMFYDQENIEYTTRT